MANVADISELLERVQSPEDAIRNEAERLLKCMEAENFSLFLISLCATFATEERPLHIQRLAVIIFKNALDSKITETREAQLRRWMELDGSIKAQIRTEILRALHHPAVDLARTVSMLIAKVASADVPRGEWPELIPTLLNNMTADPPKSSVRQATLETLGYVCEELANIPSFELNQDLVNTILTAVVRGMQKEEADDEVRLAATRALTNALEFAHTNFNNDQERTYIMRVVCEGIICSTSEEIRIAAYGCLIQICQNYYDHLPPYMNEIFKLTLHTIQGDEEAVAKQAIELWCTLCEEEIDLQDELDSVFLDETIMLHNIVKQCAPTLVPVLLTQMTKQEEDAEVDDTAWTLSMAAGGCLDLVAVCIGNNVVPVVLEFCKLYLDARDGPEAWRSREAATYALGSILEGADSQELLLYVQGNFGTILAATVDQHPAVRDTAAWTIGRVFEYLAFTNPTLPILNAQGFDTVIKTLSNALKDQPHIANRVCFAISKLVECVDKTSQLSLSPYFVGLITSLVDVAFKPVSDRGMQIRLQASAFEAINGMIRGAPDDCMDNVLEMLKLILQKLRETMHHTNAAPEDYDRISELQGMLCGCLGVVLRRLESCGRPEYNIDLSSADGTMELLIALFQTKHSAVHEEAMMAVGSLTFAVKNEFNRYMAQFMPFLEIGLRNHQETQVCISTIGTLSNICQAISDSISPYCDPIMEVLIATLQSDEVSRDIKPHALSTLADIALAVGTAFGKYLRVVGSLLQSAVELSVQEGGTIDEEFTEFNHELRKAILEAFSGILQGVGRHEAEKCLHQESQVMIDFVERVVAEAPRDEAMTSVAVGLLGDIAHALPSLNVVMKQKKWIDAFVTECARSDVPTIKDTAHYAATAIAKAAATTATSA